MHKYFLAALCFLVICSLLGCTMDVSQPPGTDLPPNVESTSSSNVTIPITWSHLNLSGRLVYSTIAGAAENYVPMVQVLDLATGELKTIFKAEGNAWIYYLTICPGENQLVMAYAPPSEPGTVSNSGLYTLPLEESASPQLLHAPATTADQYAQVECAPDGKYLYYVQFNAEEQTAGVLYPHYKLFRVAYPDGQPELVLDHAFWLRVSPDSSELVYVSTEPGNVINKMYISKADGSNPQEVVFSGPPQIIDAPIFTPDGGTILFSAPSPAQSYQRNWFEWLMGVQVAEAHNIPSDWWSVPVNGGTVTRLTQIQTIKLFASISPDLQHIASLSGEGIFVMGLDGSNLTRLLVDPGVSSTISWLP